eukprot:3941107-Rhodomonas_salina.2
MLPRYGTEPRLRRPMALCQYRASRRTSKLCQYQTPHRAIPAYAVGQYRTLRRAIPAHAPYASTGQRIAPTTRTRHGSTGQRTRCRCRGQKCTRASTVKRCATATRHGAIKRFITGAPPLSAPRSESPPEDEVRSAFCFPEARSRIAISADMLRAMAARPARFSTRAGTIARFGTDGGTIARFSTRAGTISTVVRFSTDVGTVVRFSTVESTVFSYAPISVPRPAPSQTPISVPTTEKKGEKKEKS